MFVGTTYIFDGPFNLIPFSRLLRQVCFLDLKMVGFSIPVLGFDDLKRIFRQFQLVVNLKLFYGHIQHYIVKIQSLCNLLNYVN